MKEHAVVPPSRVGDAEVLWEPFDGFQQRAAEANADEVFIGGAKGCGKGDLLTMTALRWIERPRFAGLFLRESFPELQRQIDRAMFLYGKLPESRRPAWNGDSRRFTWNSRAFIQYGYLRVLTDVRNYQGGNWARISYDELGNQADERVADMLISELRCPDPSIRRQFMGSGNPGFAGHAWTKRRYVAPCGKDGKQVAWTKILLPDGRRVNWSRQFVPGRVTDNPVYANDATYMAQLMLLPDKMRKCLLEGDYDAATGMALDELDPAVHLVAPFEVPPHWPYLSSFDWGFDHPAVFMWGRVSDDGRVYVCDTIKKRLMRDADIAGTLNERVPAEALVHVHAGHDCWNEVRARGENAPQTAEFFNQCGIHLTRANISRVSGYRNLLRYMSWRESEYLPRRQPMVQFFDTPMNRKLVEVHLASMVNDPDDVSDVLKVDYDADTDREDGWGGDDGYDCLRYLLASRPLKADSGLNLLKRSAWHPDVLRVLEYQLRHPETKPTKPKVTGLYTGV